MAKDINFEQNIKDLENVVHQLEGGNISLDRLLALFEKGVGLAKLCNSELDNAEQKINILIQNKSTGEMVESPMPAMDSNGAAPPMENSPIVTEAAPDVHSVAEPAEELEPPTPELPPPPPETESDDLQQAFMDVDDL